MPISGGLWLSIRLSQFGKKKKIEESKGKQTIRKNFEKLSSAEPSRVDGFENCNFTCSQRVGRENKNPQFDAGQVLFLIKLRD